jgi:hypothetical protein
LSYCLSCTAHKLLLSWTKLINVSQSIMIYVIIGWKKQTELNSTDLRPTSVVLRPSTCLPAGLKRSGEFSRHRPMSAPLWPRPKAACSVQTKLQAVICYAVCEYLTQQHGTSSGWGWRRCPPHMEGSCENIVYATMYGQ